MVSNKFDLVMSSDADASINDTPIDWENPDWDTSSYRDDYSQYEDYPDDYSPDDYYNENYDPSEDYNPADDYPENYEDDARYYAAIHAGESNPSTYGLWQDTRRIDYDDVASPAILNHETIDLHLGRAAAYPSTTVCVYEIDIVTTLLARTFREYSPDTRSEYMDAIFSAIPELNISNYDVDTLIYNLIVESNFNFNFLCEVLDYLDDRCYDRFIVMCAVEWSNCARRGAKHIKQVRFFTEQLDDAQMVLYFQSVGGWGDDLESSKFLITKIFSNWIRDYDFQVHLIRWILNKNLTQTYRFFASTYGFYPDAIMDSISDIFVAVGSYTYRPDLFQRVLNDYLSHEQAVSLIFDIIDNSTPTNDCYAVSHCFKDILNMVCNQMTPTNKRLFLCEVLRRLMQINSSSLYRGVVYQNFKDVCQARMLAHYLNWCNFSRDIPYEFGGQYSRLSQSQKDKVFSSVCIANNIAGAQWVITQSHDDRYTVKIVDNQIVSFDIKEDGITLTLFDRVFDSPLCRRGFKAADINTCKNKNDECAVCMDTLESTVVLNCHPSHQICEGCCDKLMTMHMKASCPLCRGRIEPTRCTVYVM